ncbi:MAG TPA: hypothetical protein VIL48_22290 [Acidimicrobiales bacterium]
MALTAMGLLFASACGQGGDDQTEASGGDRLTPAAASSEASGARRSAKGNAQAATDEDTTTTTAEDEADAEAREEEADASPTTTAADPDAGAAVCEGSGADIAPVRGRTQDAPGECIELGTGDVQVTLRWTSEADLDLHVTEPDGTEIYFANRGPTSTGGQLDVDSNVGCHREASVENVFWPTGRAPEGEYTIEVNGFSVDGCGGGDYTVTARVHGEEVLSESGSVGEDETDTYTITV